MGWELQEVITAIASHPNKGRIALLIDNSNISDEDADMALSGVAMNLLMEEDLDVSEGPEISIIGKLSQIQWQTLLSVVKGKIALENENEGGSLKAKIEIESVSLIELESYLSKTAFIQKSKQYTMVAEDHLEILIDLVDDINKNSVKGELVECGVWKGGCVMVMAMSQMQCDTNRNIYLYDTFEGMTEPKSDKDEQEVKQTYNKILTGEYKRGYDNWHGENKWAFCPLDAVKENVSLTKYPEEKIFYVKGDVLETLDGEIIPESISILRLDTDWYNSTKKELEVLFPKVSIGGFIVIDDYMWYRGARTATDEFLNEHSSQVEIVFSKERSPLILKKIS